MERLCPPSSNIWFFVYWAQLWAQLLLYHYMNRVWCEPYSSPLSVTLFKCAIILLYFLLSAGNQYKVLVFKSFVKTFLNNLLISSKCIVSICVVCVTVLLLESKSLYIVTNKQCLSWKYRQLVTEMFEDNKNSDSFQF